MIQDKWKIQLAQLHESDWWADYRKDILSEVPEINPYNPGTQEIDKDRWIYESGLKEGYLLALTHFGVKHD